jgi:hypothetical chaperone protein
MIRLEINAIGVDFGTSNSAVTCLDSAGAPQLARFTSSSGESATFPSVLYFERELEHGAAAVHAHAGATAVERYLSKDSPGRLMRSLKAFLANKNFEGTSVYGKHLTLIDLIAVFLNKLLAESTTSLGPLPKRVVVGRPVNFSMERTGDTNELALTRLREAVEKCGFEQIEFEYEPIAAAYTYERQLQRDELILVGDFGGGTSDFSVLPVGPGPRSEPGARTILGNDGVAVAGDAFDREIVKHLVAPALGFGSEYQAAPDKTLPIPNWPYAILEQWHSLSMINKPKVLQSFNRILPLALDPIGIEAFIHFVSADQGLQLYESVRSLKIALSQAPEATFTFHCEPATITRKVSRADFESWIEPELSAMGAAIDRVLAASGVQRDKIDRVFLTGGSAFVPAVRRLFADRFGADKIAGGGEFTSVATGLALRAGQVFQK